MKNEIRGLLAGLYGTHEDTYLEITKTDNGTSILSLDYDLGIYYHWVIDECGKITHYESGDIADAYQEEMNMFDEQ